MLQMWIIYKRHALNTQTYIYMQMELKSYLWNNGTDRMLFRAEGAHSELIISCNSNLNPFNSKYKRFSFVFPSAADCVRIVFATQSSYPPELVGQLLWPSQPVC